MPGTGSATTSMVEAGDHVRDLDLEPAARRQPVGLAQLLAVQVHAAGLGDLRRAGAGEPEQPGQRRVDPLAGEPVGHGHRARVRHSARSTSSWWWSSSASASGGVGRRPAPRRAPRGSRTSRVPSRWMPSAARSTMSDRGDDDRDVGDVADEPVAVGDEVDDVPARRARAPGTAGRRGCRARRRAGGRARRPSARDPIRRLRPHDRRRSRRSRRASAARSSRSRSTAPRRG